MTSDMPDRHIPVKHDVDKYAQRVVAPHCRRFHNKHMKNLAKLREDRGLSQSQLAEMVGCNQATISKIEKGKNYTITMAERIARALNVKVVDLFGHEEIEARFLNALKKASAARKSAVLLLLEGDDEE